MRGGEICVYYFTEVLGESQPKISRHLAYLRNAGIASARRDGKWIYYKLEMPKSVYAENILQDALEWLAMQEDMRADYEKLIEASCLNKASEVIYHEPSSNISIEADIKTKTREELETFLL